jgi:WNK lysine deficient protein kinase
MDPKRKAAKTHKENEAIQFDFDIVADDFEEIASEMYKSSLILEEDSRAVAKLLKVQVHTLLKDRNERIAQKKLAKLKQALEQMQQNPQVNVENASPMIQQQTQTPSMSQTPQNISNTSHQQQTTPLKPVDNVQHQITPNANYNQQQQQSIQQPISMLPTSQTQQQKIQQQQQQIQLQQQQIQLQQQQIQQQQMILQGQQQTLPVINNTSNNNMQMQQSPILHDQQMTKSTNPHQQQHHQQSSTAGQTADSGINVSTPQSVSGASSNAGKKRRGIKSSERYPKLVVLSLSEEKIVECEMEVKPKTIVFKFDVFEVNPEEVAKDLVRLIKLLH